MEQDLLVSQHEDHYGSLDDNAAGGPSETAGLIQTIPKEGYCLVFEKELEYGFTDKTTPYLIEQVDNTLKIGRHPDLVGGRSEYGEDGWELKLQEALGCKSKDGPYDLLSDFKNANISYYITTDRIDKYFFVIIQTSRKQAEKWADHHKIDLPIDPLNAIKAGRDFDDFWLAHRTYIDEDEEDDFFEIQDIEKDKIKFDKLETKCWENIHLPFNESVNRTAPVFHREHGSVINHRLYLRILYEMLTDDRALGGANFIVSRHLKESHHPLVHFFALRGPKADRPPTQIKDIDIIKEKEENNECCTCNSICYRCVEKTLDDRMKECDEIREYYGESVGFYFHFLVHYTKWLYPMSILGAIWFIIQMSWSKKHGIATPGSTVIVLVAIMWSTFMIENWYRREWKLRFEWGMMRYKETEVPRPTFKGTIEVSLENAEIIETYSSWWQYCCKITCSMSTMLLCIAIVVAIVASLFLLKRSNREDQELTVMIGMANSIQIFIMNKLYTWLAGKLNEWEGHRLQQDFYNNLVIKRIIFIVFNSFYSLFYIAFIDDIYSDDRIRLEAVRTQLITLFLMAIFLQNTMEILFPWLAKKIAQMCAKKDEEEYIENINSRTQSEKGLLAGDNVDDNSKGVLVGVGKGSVNGNLGGSMSEYDVIEDVEEQIPLSVSPDVLDNTAEIVVLQGYIMLFVIIFPLMPFLASINNFIEFKVDKYNLFNAKRPMPASAAGLGVWKSVLAVFNIIAVFSNLAILTFRTPLIKNVLDDVNNWGSNVNLIIFYFCAVLLLLGVIFIIRIVIDDQPSSTHQAVARQEACERHLLMRNKDELAAKQVQQQQDQHDQKNDL